MNDIAIKVIDGLGVKNTALNKGATMATLNG